jgi:peptidoglycan/LPS O-acetylase OafA/YrhL
VTATEAQPDRTRTDPEPTEPDRSPLAVALLLAFRRGTVQRAAGTAARLTRYRAVNAAFAGRSTAPPRTFRPDIEGLRAVAVVTVVLAHAGLAFPGGFVGVDVFFVISGFLITRQLVSELDRRGKVSFARFYARRFRRIVPAAAVVVVATVLACGAWLSPLRIEALSRDAVWSALSFVNWRLAQQGTDYFHAGTAPSPFQHYWSLSVEEQFYLVWPILLVLTALLAGRRWGQRRAVVVALAAVVVVSFTLSVLVTAQSQPWAYFGSHTRAWELAAGALLAVTVPLWTRLRPGIAAALSWAGLGLIAVALFAFGEGTLYPGALAAVPVVGAVLVVAGGCAQPRWGAEVVLGVGPMQFLGRMSYSWYLWHWPVLLLLPAALDRDPDTATALVAVIGSLALAVLTHHLVEEPFRNNAGFGRHPQRPIIVGSGLIAVASAAALAVGAVVVVPSSSGSVATPSVALTPAAVVEATRATTLPADLAPPLESALRDQAPTHDCFIEYAGTAPNLTDECVFGDPNGKRTMVLLGDSHAAQWAGAIFRWGAQHGWKVWFIAKSSCQPGWYPDFIAPALHRLYTECNQFREAAFAFIQQLRPELVVVGSLSRGSTITPAGMEKSTRMLRDAGARVLFIADNPYMGIDPPDCLAQHSDDIQRCSVPRDTAGVNSPERLAEIQGALAGGAQVWDPVPYLCANTCPSVIGNIGVYKDENHLTNTFTTSLLPELDPVLMRLTGG